MRIARIVGAWVLAWVAVLALQVAPLKAQAGLPNGKQFGLAVTNAAIVHLTVPGGTSFCTIGVKTNAINYDVGTTSTNAAPTTTTTGNGVQVNAGGVVQLASFASCKNFGAIAQGSNAQLDVLYFR